MNAQSDDPDDLPDVGNIVLPESIYVRVGPSREYETIGEFRTGQFVQPVEINEDGTWVFVEFNEFYGWIGRDLVRWTEDIDSLPIRNEFEPLPTLDPVVLSVTPFIPTPTQVVSFVLTEGEDVFVRSGPGRVYDIVGQLSAGEFIENPVGRNETTTWILFQFEGEAGKQFGWIFAPLVNWLVDLEMLPVLAEDNLTPTTTFTPSSTPTQTFTPTFTYTPSPTATSTNTPTSTYTSTFTPTYTATHTPTNTELPTATLTPTFTPTYTATYTPTNTVTATLTATLTSTSTATNTATATLTLSPTDIPTQTSTNTATATNTLTPTFTATSTVTPSTTLTHTATVTETLTYTPTYTPTVTNSPTVTPSLTHTLTATLTDTDVASNAVVTTSIPTATLTLTHTPTYTSTITPSLTNTSTPTMTNTSTSTAVPTDTLTPTPTLTNTVQPTATPTHTLTFTVVPTVTSTLTVEPTTIVPSPTTTPTIEVTEEITAIAAAVEVEPSPTRLTEIDIVEVPPQSDGDSGERFPIEAIIGIIVFAIILLYIALYWNGLASADRYASGFVIEDCPVCNNGNLHVESRQERVFGIPVVRHTVRCDNCRSVLRETGNRRWRYAVDRIENPNLYDRYNGKEVMTGELASLLIHRQSSRGQTTLPEFVDDTPSDET